jgi:hypothetical protein
MNFEKCINGGPVSGIPTGSVIEFIWTLALAVCNGHGR